MPSYSKKLIIKYLLTLSVVALTFYFIGKTLFAYYAEVRLSLNQITALKLLISLAFFIFYFNLRALSWKFIISALGKKISLRDSFSIWFLGESTRYLPGKVWSFVSRAYLAEQKGISKYLTLVSLTLEIFLILLATFLFSIQALIVGYQTLLPGINSNKMSLLLFGGGIIVLLVFIKIKRKVIAKTLDSLSLDIFFKKDFLVALICQGFTWTFFGLGTVVLITNLNTQQPHFLFISNSVLSWLVGYASLLTPLGLGVRESATSLLFRPFLGNGSAVLLALLARLVFTLAEVINLGFWLVVRRGKGLRLTK